MSDVIHHFFITDCDKTDTCYIGTPTHSNRKSTNSDGKTESIDPSVLTQYSTRQFSVAAPSSCRGLPFLSTPTRPTKEEASDLWEIMSTPPESYTRISRDWLNRRDNKRNESMRFMLPECVSSSSNGLDTPLTILEPTYEALPHERTQHQCCYSVLRPMKGRNDYLEPRMLSGDLKSPLTQHCKQCGLGPFLSLLPESIMYSIISYIDYVDRQPTLLLVSHGMSKLLKRPEFLLEMKNIHERSRNRHCYPWKTKSLLSQVLCEPDYSEEEHWKANELLLVVGGKCPTKTNNHSYNDNDQNRVDMNAAQSLEQGRLNRRMVMQNNEQSGIMAYDPRREKWVRFGGDPLEPMIDRNLPTSATSDVLSPKRTTLHPLSPFGIIDAKPLFVDYPYFCLVLLGGTHYRTGAPSSRVIAYSFLSGSWEDWPEMIRARHGEDFVVATVESAKDDELGLSQIVLIGCDLGLCDCFRCNPPHCWLDEDDATGMNIDVDSGVVRKKVDFDSIGRCEVLDLKTRTWVRRKSRAPSAPPDDGGVAVVAGRFIYLPGTCPPPPTAWRHTREESFSSGDGEASRVVTPMQSEINSHNECEKDQFSLQSTDAESEIELSNLFCSLLYRPGLRYDCWQDQWIMLPVRPYVTTSSPTTVSWKDNVIVLGGYRSSCENSMSCYRHREEDSILDYEDHLDYAWWYRTPSLNDLREKSNVDRQRSEESGFPGTLVNNGEWTFGGGTTKCGHHKSWAQSSEMAAAVPATLALKNEENHQHICLNMPRSSPVPVRGATATIYQGRLTLLGGLSTFSRSFYDSERKTIWQFFGDDHGHQEWRRAPMTLPAPALLGGFSFSMHV